MNKIALLISSVFLIMPITLAQGIQPKLDETSMIYPVLFFFNYQVPTTLHQFGNSIGITANDVVSQDFQDMAVELQLENVDLMDKYNNNQVDDDTFQRLNENIMNSEDDAATNLNDVSRKTASVDDDIIANELDDSENVIADVESHAGINVEQVSESDTAGGITSEVTGNGEASSESNTGGASNE